MELQSNTQHYVLLSLFSDSQDTAARPTLSEELHCSPCIPRGSPLRCCPSAGTFWAGKTSLAAATSPTGKDVWPFLKWRAELEHDNHKLFEDDCWCHDASSLLLKVTSGKKIAHCFLLVNAEVFPLLSLQAEPHTCSSWSPGYKDHRVTAGQRWPHSNPH